ncbi:MAG: hypothetical protein SF123_17670 [Chloroflexota bacterium]|nr:hypothetical protein [Chloroflexota bacterium]
MFTVTVNDEKVYQQLMARVRQRGESLDDVLRELLDQEALIIQTTDETPARKLLRLIDDADLPFTNPFNGRDASDLLRDEAGTMNWRNSEGDNGTA